MAQILIIEDERVIRSALRRLLTRHGYGVAVAGSIPDAERSFDLASFDLIVSDLRLPGPPGTDVIARAGKVPVLIMTSYASIKSAVDAMQLGAANYIAKPFDHDEFLASIRQILADNCEHDRSATPPPPSAYPISGILGNSPKMQRVFNDIRKIAPTDSTVLILGESGTGKELVARALHEHSPRVDAPFIVVNCAAIPEGLIESELFGHEKGAFTGATGTRQGLVEAANSGTLFLDEVGELAPTAQSRLLRVLQENEIRRLGAVQSRQVDVRLIAATNRDLQELVDHGEFRSDLFYRLRVIEVHLPPLRERGEDIIALAEFTLEQTCKRLKRPMKQLASAARQALTDYHWPGNIRELKNAVERAVILSDSTEISADLLALSTHSTRDSAPGLEPLPAPPALSLDEYFYEFVVGNQHEMTETELARRLGISRKSLWERRQKLSIARPPKRRG